jgi:hypothetical protein
MYHLSDLEVAHLMTTDCITQARIASETGRARPRNLSRACPHAHYGLVYKAQPKLRRKKIEAELIYRDLK